MAEELSGKRVAILATDGVERVEPIHGGEIAARNHAARAVAAAGGAS